jgi:two-component system sensor histidine kinase KdpD
VNNLLDMARLQSGPVRLRREWQPLEDVVGAALQASARQLAGHRLRLDLPLDLPLVNVDAVLMERALCNLFENAAKYTPPGSAIGIVARPLDDWIEVVVADDGPGLPPGREHELFAKFTRGRSESTIPGVGLGLAIVQAIVEAHGGRVRAENREGGGSRFVLELPRGEPPELPDRDA